MMGSIQVHTMHRPSLQSHEEGVQDTPHGVEGDSHSGPKPLVPCSLTQVPCSTPRNGCHRK